MKNPGGTWRGEYRINYGTEENPDSHYFHFQVRIKNGEDGFEGKFKDLTLISDDSELQGFQEADFISFVRQAKYTEEFTEYLHIPLTPRDKVIEFIFNGNWSEDDESFVGIWEVEIEEERNGLQEDVFTESRKGEWYMRKF